MNHSFASDNNSGVCSEVMAALAQVNIGHEVGYGADPYTKQAIQIFKDRFGADTEVFFVFNGTGANVLSLSCLTDSYHAVLCTEAAHINEDECGAPEKFTGSKLWDFFAPDAKLNPDMLQYTLANACDEHRVQPKVISITQSTEFGTLYSVDEIKALADFAHSHDMYLHLDGARIANAAVSLGLDFKAFTKDAGVDVVSFGGTKNGMMYGEAVLFFNPELSKRAKFFRKQGMQLASKMRYISAQFSAYFENDTWHKNASHANAMAQKLATKIKAIEGPVLYHPVQANGVFVQLPDAVIAKLREHHFFYIFDEKNRVARFMCSYDTPESEVERLAKDIEQAFNSLT